MLHYYCFKIFQIFFLNLVLATLHVRYHWKNFRAGHCRVTEEVLAGKVRFERQPVWIFYFSELPHSGKWMKYFMFWKWSTSSGTVRALSTSFTSSTSCSSSTSFSSSSSFLSLFQYNCTVKAVCKGGRIRTLTVLIS